MLKYTEKHTFLALTEISKIRHFLDVLTAFYNAGSILVYPKNLKRSQTKFLHHTKTLPTKTLYKALYKALFFARFI